MFPSKAFQLDRTGFEVWHPVRNCAFLHTILASEAAHVQHNFFLIAATYDTEFDHDLHSFSHTCVDIIMIEYDLTAVQRMS